MRKIAFVPVALLAVGLSLAGCGSTASSDASKPSATATPSSSSTSATPADAAVTKTGSFTGLNEKKVAGSAKVTGTELVLSGFSSDEGPDLHVYLTKGTDEAAVAAGMRIDAVAYDKAMQTFALKNVDLSQYTDVVIHCDKAKAVFGAAALS